MTTKKPENTKAPARREEKVDEPVTKLAVTPDPAALTDKEIHDLTQDDGTDSPENSANRDAAEAMKQDRAEAKGKDTAPHAGGFQGEPG